MIKGAHVENIHYKKICHKKGKGQNHLSIYGRKQKGTYLHIVRSIM